MKATKATKESREKIINEFGGDLKNTGSTEVQIAIFTERINYLTDHFRTHKQDSHSRRGLITLVNKRRKLLSYLKETDAAKYKEILQRLNLRK